MQRVLAGLVGVVNAHDDILIFAVHEAQLRDRVEQTLKRLEDSGLTLNAEKCIFNAPEVNFFGLKFTGSGVNLMDLKEK